MAMAVFIPTLFPTLADLRRAAHWLWWPGVVAVAAAMLDLLRDEARIAGVFGNANMASLYINFFAPLGVYGYLCARRGRRWPYLLGLGLSAFAFVLCGSRSGYLTIPLIVLFFAATLRPVRRMMLWAAPAFLVALILLVPRFESFVAELETRSFYGSPTGRFKIDLSTGARILDLAAGTRMFLDHPVAGVGIGNYSANFVAYIPDSLRHSQWANLVVQTGDLSSHNLLVLVGAEMGLVGLFFFLGFFLLIFLYFARAWQLLPAGPDRVLLICFIVSALGTLASGSLHGGFAYRHYVGWYVGIAYIFWRQARESPPTPLVKGAEG
ncbi:O-antigen ligase family protein [bacterium]|nr:O-antigen ligase family protein [bacterium]